MALSKREYLYRLRIMFDPDGSVKFVDAANSVLIEEDGKVLSDTGAGSRIVQADSGIANAVAKLIQEFERVRAAEDKQAAAKAEAKRKAEETAAVEAANKAKAEAVQVFAQAQDVLTKAGA